MAVDIVILLMPIYPVWTLHTTTANKLAVSGMLALGVLYVHFNNPLQGKKAYIYALVVLSEHAVLESKPCTTS